MPALVNRRPPFRFCLGDLTRCFSFRYKVSYPTMYAIESENKDAKLFNCVQVLPKILSLIARVRG